MLSADDVLKISAQLDERFHALRGDPVSQSKDIAFRRLIEILETSGVPYALIGGVAVQLWQSEPRTTLDVDIAVSSYEALPVSALEKAGFQRLARHAHSESWRFADGTPVQFTDDPWFAETIATAVKKPLGDHSFRVASARNLVRAKLRAAADASRRRSKRLQDLADAQGLVEEDPTMLDGLTDLERAVLEGNA